MPDASTVDDPAKVTLAHLTRAEHICARRVARDHAQHRANAGGTSRWLLSNRVLEDVRLAHTELARPRLDRFLVTPDLAPEQARVYELAARWYVTLFGDRAVRAVDEDPWGTDRPEGVRLVGPAGLGVADEQGRAEIRLLQLGSAHGVPRDLPAAPAVRFALLRRPDWLDGRTVRVIVADLVLGTYADDELDTARERPVLEEWFATRLEVIRARVADATPTPGLECGWCPHIAGCEPHRR
jgi:hypothetical protein